jgi:hypothetical protein
MKHFKSPRQMQRFLPSTIQVANIFTRRRNQDRNDLSFCSQSGLRRLGRRHRCGHGGMITSADLPSLNQSRLSSSLSR